MAPEVPPIVRATPERPSYASDHSHGCLEDGQLESLRLQAVAGDSAASYALARHHGDCEDGILQHYLFYLRLAGEQGDCQALDEFAQQQSQGFLDALKTPGEWKKRARRCAHETLRPDG